ncbi:MAG: hypothetical protein AAF456_19845, partial [Planctomycetota bacterium]
MASPTTSKQTARRTAAQQRSARIQQYVNEQLEKTRKRVKTVDIFTSILGIAAVGLGVLLLLILIDAWIIPLTPAGRWVGLITLIVSVLGYAAWTVFPLVVRKINPQYAAKMIEDSEPGFKNRLLNYLSLRDSGSKMPGAVTDIVARQAAEKLSNVPDDTTVDRSGLIRAGFLLVGLVTLAVLYTILSPKSPFATIGRILSPGAKISQPSIVTIAEVTPGDCDVFFGESLEITARISGSHDPADVRIVFSSEDGQITDQILPMSLDGTAGKYKAKLTTDGNGIQQSLIYSIVARDGTSPEYSINVRPNPTISIQSVHIAPPAYTKLPERTIEGQGDVQVIEGTTIKINALANLPISVAYIELLKAQKQDDGESTEIATSTEFVVQQTTNMAVTGDEAIGEFIATLNSTRTRPAFTHYRIRFVSEDGDRNENPVVYPVKITPDHAPEIEIVDPTSREVTVPLNHKLPVRIEANDLDFEISAIDLHIDHQGTKILDRDLHLSFDDHGGGVEAVYFIDPAELGLSVGDKAVFFATAADNRIAVTTGMPDPNITATENFTLLVTEERELTERERRQQNPEQEQQPDEDQQQPEQQPEQERGDNAEQRGQDGEQQQPGDEQGTDEQTGDQTDEQTGEDQNPGEQTGQDQEQSGQQEDSTGGQEQSGGQQDGSGQQQDGTGQQQDGTGQQQDGSGQQQDGNSQPQDSGSSQQSGSEQQQSSSDPSQNGQQQSANSADPSESGESNNQAGNRAGPEGTGEETVGENQTSEGQRNMNSEGSPSGNGEGGQQQAGQAADSSSPGSRDRGLQEGDIEKLSEDASEGERFEQLQRLLEEMERKEQEQGGAGQQQQENEQESGSQSGDPSDQQPGEPGQGQPEESQQGQPGQMQDSGNQEQPSESPQQNPADQSQSGDPSGESGQQDQQTGQGSNQENQQTGENGREQEPGQQPSGNEGQQQSGTDNSENPAGENEAGDQSAGSGEQMQQPGDEGGQESGSQESGSEANGGGQSEDQTGQQQSGSSEQQTGQQDSGEQSGGGGSSEQQTGGNEQGGGEQSGNDQSGGEQQSGQSAQEEGADQESSGGSEQQNANEQSGGGSGGEQQQPGGQSGQQGSGQQGSGQQSSGEQSSGDQSSGQQQSGGEGGSGGDSGESTGDSNSESRASNPSGGTSSGRSGSRDLGEEDVNLQFAEETTDLILRRLEEQRTDPDPELLEKMGDWTAEDLANFIDKWKAMKDAAEAGDPQALQQYRRELQRLGLTPDTGRTRTVNTESNAEGGLTEDAARSLPPAEFIPGFN